MKDAEDNVRPLLMRQMTFPVKAQDHLLCQWMVGKNHIHSSDSLESDPSASSYHKHRGRSTGLSRAQPVPGAVLLQAASRRSLHLCWSPGPLLGKHVLIGDAWPSDSWSPRCIMVMPCWGFQCPFPSETYLSALSTSLRRGTSVQLYSVGFHRFFWFRLCKYITFLPALRSHGGYSGAGGLGVAEHFIFIQFVSEFSVIHG